MDYTEDKIIRDFSKDHVRAFCLREAIQNQIKSKMDAIIYISLNMTSRKILKFSKQGINADEQNNAWSKYKISSLVPDVFEGLYALEEIDLSNQAIQNIDSKILDGLFNLKKISLCGNQLEEIDSEFFQSNF